MPFHEQAFSSEQLEESAQRREKEGLLTRMFDAMGDASFGGVDVGDVSSAQRDRYDLVDAEHRHRSSSGPARAGSSWAATGRSSWRTGPAHCT